MRAPLSTSSVLDEAADAVALTAAPWAGLLIVTTLPYRLAQVVFIDRLAEAGSQAARYGNALTSAANMMVLAFLLATWGRAVYARACRLGMTRGVVPGRDALRVPKAALASYTLLAMTGLFVSVLLLPTMIGYAAALMFGGLAIGTFELNDRVSVREPFRIVLRNARALHILLAIVVIFTIGFIVALGNVGATFALGLATATAAGADSPHWSMLFGLGNRTFRLLVVAGAFLVLEPFWIAAHVVFVSKVRSRESGDDLRAWFEELRSAT